MILFCACLFFTAAACTVSPWFSVLLLASGLSLLCFNDYVKN